MAKIEFRPLPPMHPDLTPLRCFGIQITGSISAVGCLGCNHIERWEPSDGLQGSHAALTRLLEHVRTCGDVPKYPKPDVSPLDANAGPVALLSMPGRDDAFCAVYAPT